MLRKMQMEGCHLLVATPGRLNDLLTDEYSKVSAPDLTTLVLDEADRLLDEGFSRDIEGIIELLPDRNKVDRQTLLFSATIPKEVMHLVRQTLKPGFHFVQGVHEGEPATHEKVPQKLVATPGIENFMPTLLELAKREIEKVSKAQLAGEGGKPFKAIVYFSTTANVELAGRIFEELKGEEGGLFGTHPLYPAEISQMHGQLTQAERTRVSERFRRAKSALLFSTDVTARGMDFPNVTHVIQVGLPPSTEQYVHRLGRTGRGDKTGEGWIFITEDDIRDARRRLGDMPIIADKTLEAAKLDMTREAQLPTSLAATLGQISAAVKMVDRGTKARAYMASLGMSAGGARAQVPLLNKWTKYGWGWPEPPSIPMGVAQRLGIARMPGVNVQGSRRFDGDAEDSLNGVPQIGEGRDGGRFWGKGGSRGGFGNRDGDRRGGFGGRGGDRGGRDFGRRDSYDDRRGGRQSSFGRENRGSGRSSGFGDQRAQF
jgi:ATP-dependent RNA helicase MSS116